MHIALREAGRDVELVKVDLATHRLEDGADYLAVNPRGYVPLLELPDGSRHTEVAALLQYVADLAPGCGLLPPAGSAARFQALQWLAFVSSELHKAASPWLWHKETADSTRKACREKLAARLAELDRVLAQREHIAGDGFSAADVYAFVIVGWCPLLGINLQPYAHLQAWRARVAARPAVRAALRAEGLARD